MFTLKMDKAQTRFLSTLVFFCGIIAVKSEWSPWTTTRPCSATCGPGSKEVSRMCLNGGNCKGNSFRRLPCSGRNCNAWGLWKPVGECSASCNGGLQRERRECMGNINFCPGLNTRDADCNTQPCDPVWGLWMIGECSVTCGTGERVRTRECLFGECEGPSIERHVCSGPICNGVWSPWGRWSSCSVTCGAGSRTRLRFCEGGNCAGEANQEEECTESGFCLCSCPPKPNCQDLGTFCQGATEDLCRNTRSYADACPIACNACDMCHPCNLSTWGPWERGSCNCENFRRTDTRECINGNDCPGPDSRSGDCEPNVCAPTWSSWSESPCSVSCGNGQIVLSRRCLSGNNCFGRNRREISCRVQERPFCPTWSSWSRGRCSVTCGNGVRTDRRTCQNGPGCEGPDTQEVNCYAGICPTWSEWSGTCSVTCGSGTRSRARRCLNGNSCVGPSFDQVPCQESPCACRDVLSACSSYSRYCLEEGPSEFLRRNCAGTCANLCPSSSGWGRWVNGECSASCGEGTRIDRRRCLSGDSCIGPSSRIEDCSASRECIGEWSSWVSTGCSTTCGIGLKIYTRVCSIGDTCDGKNTREDFCGIPEICTEPTVPVPVCGPWMNVSSCSVTCGIGVVSQRRDSISGSCSITARLIECDAGYICDESVYGPWENVSSCSTTCGPGTIRQQRNCIFGTCLNTSREVQCNRQMCEVQVIDCWNSWSRWSSCSDSCGPGIQRRSRRGIRSPCLGRVSEITRSCNIPDCPDNDICSRSCGNGTYFDSSSRVYTDCNEGVCPQQTCPPGWANRYQGRSHECCDLNGLTTSSCGVASTGIIRPRIIAGRNSSIMNWPWTIQLSVRGTFLCGAVLLSSNYVVTAAHCVNNVKDNPSVVSLVMGVTRLQDAIVNRTALRILVHERYNATGTWENDIAIIQLNESVELVAADVNRICLPELESIAVDTECIVAGWGRTSNNGPSSNDILQEANVRILPPDVCIRAYPSQFRRNQQLCAGRIDGSVDTCSGDSGGPLMCQRCTSCAWFLAGITSFGGRCATANRPGVYTKVGSFEHWIYPRIDLPFPTTNMLSCT